VWIYPFLKSAAQNLEHEKSGQAKFEADQKIISKWVPVSEIAMIVRLFQAAD